MSNVSRLPSKEQPENEKAGVKVTLELVDIAMADRLLSLGHIEFQRKSNDAHVEELAEEINAGTFEPGTTINIAEIIGTERFILTNGTHTLKAIIATGKPQWLTIVRRRVKDIKEAGVSYTRLDIQLVRRPSQRLKALNLPEVTGLTVGECTALIAAIKLLLADFEHKPSATLANRKGPARAIFKSAERWRDGIKEYREPIRKYLSALDFANDLQQRRRLMRSSVLAVGLATMRYQPKRAWDFWASVAAEDKLRANQPANRLSNWLREHKGGSGGIAVKQAKFIARCWKADWDNTDMRSVRSLEPDLVGVTIVGTPFKARERG